MHNDGGVSVRLERQAKPNTFSIKKRLGDKKHALKQANDFSTQMKLKNAFDYSYTGPVYMGSKGQYLEVVYDTGSDWLCIESIECEAGNGPKFDFNSSTTFKQ